MGNSIPIRPTSTYKIALFGAAGAISHSIATAISAQGAPYRVVGRSRDALATAFGADSLAEIGASLRVRVAGKTMLRLLGLCNPFMREMVEMHYLLTDPVLMDDRPLQELLGQIHKTPYSVGVRECLAAVRATASQGAAVSRR